jgi:hypothetical protein
MGGCISSPAPPGAEVSDRDRQLHRQAEKALKDAKAKMAVQVKVRSSIHLLYVYLTIRLRSSSSAPATRAKARSSSRCASSTASPSPRRRPSPSDSWCLIISRGGSSECTFVYWLSGYGPAACVGGPGPKRTGSGATRPCRERDGGLRLFLSSKLHSSPSPLPPPPMLNANTLPP